MTLADDVSRFVDLVVHEMESSDQGHIPHRGAAAFFEAAWHRNDRARWQLWLACEQDSYRIETPADTVVELTGLEQAEQMQAALRDAVRAHFAEMLELVR